MAAAPLVDAEPSALASRSAWTLAALFLFAVAAASVYAPIWKEGPREVIPSVPANRMEGIVYADHGFVVWQVGRNARALVRDPLAFFDAGHCFPASHSLAYGGALIAMGILAIPAQLLVGDPVWTYNAVLLAMALIAALAIYGLVAEWTAVPAAGMVAGLLYGFHAVELGNPVHPHIFDTTWTVLAIWFGRRLFARGRWRDAVGLAASACMQLAASFYPFLAAVLLALPFGAWLVLQHRFRRLRPTRLLLAALLLALGATLILAPYLELSRAGRLTVRSVQYFARWGEWRPGGMFFPGWPCIVLAAAALLLPRRRVAGGIEGDPRWALLAGGILVAVAAAGPGGDRPTSVYGVPNLWGLLAAVLPGLDSVRTPSLVGVGAHLPLCILAGLGCAGLLRLWRWRGSTLVAAALVALIWVDTLRPGWLGLESPLGYRSLRIAPPAEDLEFFEVLAEKGNRGPIFETPIPKGAQGYRWGRTWPSVLLSAYHHRPTSACIASTIPDRSRLEEIDRSLPGREAIAELARLGFTTLVVHHPKGPPEPEAGARPRGRPERARLRAFEGAARAPDGALRILHQTRTKTAYAIAPPPGQSTSGPAMRLDP